jgi:hypothetical protein
MAAGAYNEKLSIQINHYVECLAKSYQKFLNNWKSKKNAFLLFYGLRDFYGLIKTLSQRYSKRKKEAMRENSSQIALVNQSLKTSMVGKVLINNSQKSSSTICSSMIQLKDLQ